MKLRLLVVMILCACFGQSPAQEFHLLFLNKKEDKAQLPEEEVKKLMDGHMANISKLAKEGKLWAAGPFEGGGGIFIFKTQSVDDVRSWMLTDPAIAAGRWNIEIFPYNPRTGSVCRVEESTQMTFYSFVRYSVATGKPGADKQHRDYLTSSGKRIIAEADLGEGNGSLLVLKEEPEQDWLAKDPAVKNGYLVPSLKKLYIALGAFCEPQ